MNKTKMLQKGTLLLACLMGIITVLQPVTVQAATYTRTYYNYEGTDTIQEIIDDPDITVNGDYAFTIVNNGFLSRIKPIDVTNQSGDVIIPNSVKEIDGTLGGSYLDVKNEAFVKTLYIPNTVKCINASGIEFTDITELHIPASVRYIGINGIAFNKKLKTVTMDEGVTHLDMLVFEGCTSLKDVYLPSSINKMSYHTSVMNPFKGIEKKVTVHAKKGSYAYNYCKNELGMKVVDTTNDNVKPSKVKSLNVTNIKQNSMKLTWKKASNATSYYVYQKIDGEYKQIATTGKTSYTVKNLNANNKYQFKVVSYNETSKKTGTAVTISKKTKKMDKPAAVTNLKAKKVNKNAVTLQWNKVNKTATGYRIYQYDQSNKKWVNVNTISNKKKSYTVTDLQSKTSYKFKIVTENKKSYGTATSNATKVITVKTK